MNNILIILAEYIIIAVVTYIILNHVELSFYKEDKEIELSPKMKKIVLIRVSVFWIITIPLMIISQWRH